MLALCSFLQSVCHMLCAFTQRTFSVNKQMYRSYALLMAGTVLVAVMTFGASGFSGNGHNAITAYAETTPFEESDPESETGEAAEVTEAKIQVRLIGSEQIKEGRLLAGDTLMRSVLEEQELRRRKEAAAEKNKEEIRQIQEKREKEAKKQEARRALGAQEYEVLTRIVQAEAGICDMKGRILVANVILNRVRDSEFPDTVTEVVYQKAQFSPVLDGRIETCRVTEQTIEAVDRALAGEDYSQGALYFMNRQRSYAKNISWFDSRLTFLFHHDGHEFFK